MADKNRYSNPTFDLATARTGISSEVQNLGGDFVSVAVLDGVAYIAFDDVDAGWLSLGINRQIFTKFSRFWIKNTAQVGKTLEIIIGRGAEFQAVSIQPTSLVDATGAPLTPLSMAGTVTLYNKAMAAANTEYSQALPAGTKKYTVRLRDQTIFRLAFVTGKVATPVEPYLTVPAPEGWTDELISPTALTLYFASPNAGKTAEICAWS